jgi:hypothetical protein
VADAAVGVEFSQQSQRVDGATAGDVQAIPVEPGRPQVQRDGPPHTPPAEEVQPHHHGELSEASGMDKAMLGMLW